LSFSLSLFLLSLTEISKFIGEILIFSFNLTRFFVGVYEHSKKLIRHVLCDSFHFSQRHSFIVEVMISGALSGMSGWFASFPLDVIKTNIQGHFGTLDPITKKLEPKQKFWPTTKKILKTHGFFGLYSVSIISFFFSFLHFSINEFLLSKFAPH
jgi:hypothetical protein